LRRTLMNFEKSLRWEKSVWEIKFEKDFDEFNKVWN